MNLFDIIKAIFAENEEELPDSFSNFLTNDTTIATDILNSINNVNTFICTLDDWQFRQRKTTFDTVINQDEYTKPEGKIYKVKIQDRTRELDIIDYEHIINNPRTGEPEFYSFFGENLVLYPTPISIKTVTAYFYTNDFAKTSLKADKEKLENETDYSIIPRHLHYAIVYGACIEYYKKPSKDKYLHWQKQYNTLLKGFEHAIRNSVEQSANFSFGSCNKNSLIKDFFNPNK